MGLDIVELVMMVEEEFGISIPDHEAEKLETVGALFDCAMEKVVQAANSESPPDHHAMWNRYRALVATQFGFETDRVVRSARLVDDLQLD